MWSISQKVLLFHYHRLCLCNFHKFQQFSSLLWCKSTFRFSLTILGILFLEVSSVGALLCMSNVIRPSFSASTSPNSGYTWCLSTTYSVLLILAPLLFVIKVFTIPFTFGSYVDPHARNLISGEFIGSMLWWYCSGVMIVNLPPVSSKWFRIVSPLPIFLWAFVTF